MSSKLYNNFCMIMGKAKIMLMMSLYYYCALVTTCLKIIVSCESVLE